MPKDTFFNLDEKKQQVIFNAAVKEFTENELHKARVSNIIREACIPRGSFYQYFEDIDDLYYYVIDTTFDKVFNEGYKHAEMTDNLFEYVILTFEIDYKAYSQDRRDNFMKNVYKSIGSNVEYIQHHNTRRRDYILKVLDHMDLSNVRVSEDPNERVKLYEFLQRIKISVIQHTFVKRNSLSEAKEQLRWYLDILKHGLLEEE